MKHFVCRERVRSENVFRMGVSITLFTMKHFTRASTAFLAYIVSFSVDSTVWTFVTDISMDRIVYKRRVLLLISSSFGTCVDLNLRSLRLCDLLWRDAVYFGTYFLTFPWRNTVGYFQNADTRLKTTRCNTHQGHNKDVSHSKVYNILMSGLLTNYLKPEIRDWLGNHKLEHDEKAIRCRGFRTHLCVSYFIILDIYLLQTLDLVSYRRREQYSSIAQKAHKGRDIPWQLLCSVQWQKKLNV